MDGLEVMQGYGCWCMEVCLMRKWRDIWLVGFIVKMLQNNGQDIHMCNSALPALNSVPIYIGRQSLPFCRFCQLRILLQFSPNTTLVPSDSDFSLVPSCSYNSPLLSHLRTAPCTSCSTPAQTPDQCQLSGPTSNVTLMKTVDELVWANSQVLGCRGIFTVGLLQPLEFDVAVRGPKTG